MEKRNCTICNKEFQPTWPIQKECKHCLQEKIDSNIEKLRRINEQASSSYNNFIVKTKIDLSRS